jgi:hypothetical protein
MGKPGFSGTFDVDLYQQGLQIQCYADIIVEMKITALTAVLLIILVSCAGVESVPATGSFEPDSGAVGGAADAEERTEDLPEVAESGDTGGNRQGFEAGESAAGPEDNIGSSVEPAEIVTVPMTELELLLSIEKKMPWNLVQVTDGAEPLIIFHDLDKNGYEDALVLAIEGGPDKDASVENLSRSARLFQNEKDYNIYFLLIFYQNENGVSLRYTVPAAKQLVFNGMKPFQIRTGSDFPYAVNLSFRTRSGIEEELIILSGYGITRFRLVNNLSVTTMVSDIDGSGYNDIIIHEQGFEEGTGFETFLTWYKWNLREYIEYKNTNIVRNLREFFRISSDSLKSGDAGAFFNYAVDPELLSEVKKQGFSDSEILEMIFRPADGGDWENGGFFEQESFSAVVFPDLMETPFSYDGSTDFRHTVSVRFGVQGGESRICLAELRMKKNPFQEKQFCFCIDKEI